MRALVEARSAWPSGRPTSPLCWTSPIVSDWDLSFCAFNVDDEYTFYAFYLMVVGWEDCGGRAQSNNGAPKVPLLNWAFN